MSRLKERSSAHSELNHEKTPIVPKYCPES
jgi:hypothetical protein